MTKPAVLSDVQENRVPNTPIAEYYERASVRILSKLGPSESVQRFAR